MRSYEGCWTCRLRRKKCDEKRPICRACSAFHITCDYSPEKPSWMDGGTRQQQQATEIKQQIKHNAHLRRIGEIRAEFEVRDEQAANTARPAPETTDIEASSHHDERVAASTSHCTNEVPSVSGLKSSDMVLIMYYIEQVMPFLFPFYQPSIMEGGKAWMLDLIIKSPVVRRSTLCQSAYFMSRLGKEDADWETVLAETNDAFEMLRQALQVVQNSDIRDHLHGAVRIFTSIMQLYRFEVALKCFSNCEIHLNAAMALFRQIIESATVQNGSPKAAFHSVLNSLGPSSWRLPDNSEAVPNAEQSAFCFSTALLLFDDVMSSLALQRQPALLDYHQLLLEAEGISLPLAELRSVTGCPSWIIIQLGKIAALVAWSSNRDAGAGANSTELEQHVTIIRQEVLHGITHMEAGAIANNATRLDLLDTIHTDSETRQNTLAARVRSSSRAWAFATLLYLAAIVPRTQSAESEMNLLVEDVLELLTNPEMPPAFLNTLSWPYFVAGCLAGSQVECSLRALADRLQPQSLYATFHRAFGIMEKVWQDRKTAGLSSKSLLCYLRDTMV